MRRCADFDGQLAEKLAAVGTASDNRDSGRSERVGGTEGLDAKADRGIAIPHEMDSILSYWYRDNPALLASWKSACHIDFDPSRADEDEEPPLEAPSAPPKPLAMAAVEPRVNGSSGALIA